MYIENENNNDAKIMLQKMLPKFKLIKLDKNNIQITGTEDLDQDYIFTNFYYERDPRYTDKYLIPKNYKKIFSIKRGHIIINEIYKKN